MTVFVAFLRGINLGKRRIKMADLKSCFETMGFQDARTLLASGNVVFDAGGEEGLGRRIELGLEERFGFKIGVALRTREALCALVNSDPFGGPKEDADTKLYVTFLGAPEAGSLPMPCKVEGDFEVLKAVEGEVFSIAHRMRNGRFGPGMEAIGRHFGKKTLWTTRNWNTVLEAIGG